MRRQLPLIPDGTTARHQTGFPCLLHLLSFSEDVINYYCSPYVFLYEFIHVSYKRFGACGPIEQFIYSLQ